MYLHFNNGPFIEQISGEGELLHQALHKQQVFQIVAIVVGITAICAIAKMFQYQAQVKQFQEKGNVS
jgi:uncharacterized membrane protein YuzA (DUF378 family)